MLKTLGFVSCCMLFSTANASAQILPDYPDARLIEMPYQNSRGERGCTFFRYGRDNRLCNTVWKLADGSRSSINFHLYDDRGLEKEKYREFSDGLSSSEEYLYDEEGRRVQETFKRSDGVGGTGKFAWDSHSRLVSADCDNYKGWFTGKVLYIYREGQRAGAKIERNGKAIGSITYKYDETDRLVEEHWDFNGQWNQTFSYRYEPVPKKVYAFSSPFVALNPDFRVLEEDYDFNGEGGGPSRYRYDKEGKLVEKVYETTDGLKTTTTYVYNDKGDLLSSHRVYSTGQTADFTYAFDPRGRLVERRFRRSDSKEGFERFAWDRLGRLSKAVYKNMDFWLNGTITFTYDKLGRLAKGRFEGEDGFDADLLFETDDYANVLKMHWKFTFGKTQTYYYKYMPVKTIPCNPEESLD